MKKITINLLGKRIGCSVVQIRKHSLVLQPEGKKVLFRGTAKITIPKKNVNL